MTDKRFSIKNWQTEVNILLFSDIWLFFARNVSSLMFKFLLSRFLDIKLYRSQFLRSKQKLTEEEAAETKYIAELHGSTSSKQLSE
jgi:hypothetical protein